MTPLEITTSKHLSSNGSASMRDWTSSTCGKPPQNQPALASWASVMSTPTTRPVSPTSTAAQKMSVPEPEPRSSTVSPGRRAARSR